MAASPLAHLVELVHLVRGRGRGWIRVEGQRLGVRVGVRGRVRVRVQIGDHGCDDLAQPPLVRGRGRVRGRARN